ncbi:MAG: hypothetical protein AAF490_02975 [Chloroflexota bacterium]
MSDGNSTFEDVLIVLLAAYPNANFNEDTEKIYRLGLADIEPELLKTAVLHHITNNKWFPTIAELRESVAEIISKVNGETPSAFEAWQLVSKAFSSHGRNRTPDFPPMVAKAVEAVGGWRYLCDSETPMPDRAHFFRAFESLQNRQQKEAMQLPQIGDFVNQKQLAIKSEVSAVTQKMMLKKGQS